MKYGIGHSQTHSLREIASELGVSKERVRQIVHQATRTLQYHGMRFGID
jgi:DNA-directed RNA polymerase sigma subunit (sigma70/sigma32)